jgi:hypothetical protein
LGCDNAGMAPFFHEVTFSGPFGQYTVQALVDATSTFSIVPAPALLEMSIEPLRIVRIYDGGEAVRFGQVGRVLTRVDGVEDLAPVLFGEPGLPTVLGSLTLSLLLLQPDEATQTLVPLQVQAPADFV